MSYYFSSAIFDVGRLEPGKTYETNELSECKTVVDRDGDRAIQSVDWLRYKRVLKIDEDKRILFDSAHLVVARCRDSRVEVSWDGDNKTLETEFCSLKVSRDTVSMTIN